MAQRAIFEDVSGKPVAPAAARVAERLPWRTGIALWLFALAGLVAVMVLVGGLTRLTDSGLSITVWDPVMGAIPPLSDADWQAAFAAYRTTTEFQDQNAWMTLDDFKPIFWWEWGHRALGRLIGLVWAAGFAVFLIARRIPQGWTARLVLPGLLGGVQGAIGWWVVSSGLSGRLDVAPYRLGVHLGLAFTVFALLLWYAWRVRRDAVETLAARRRRVSGPGAWTVAVGAVLGLQILSGALVAGLDAGRAYVDWPLMQGSVLPPESFDLSPVWLNLFENPALAQFDHRIIGYVLAILAAILAIRAGRWHVPAVTFWARLLGVAVLAQAAWGVVTVMHAAPLTLAIVHQAGALVLVAMLMRLRLAALYPPETSIRRG